MADVSYSYQQGIAMGGQPGTSTSTLSNSNGNGGNGLVIITPVSASSVPASNANYFFYTGAAYTYTVPVGTSNLLVKMWGGGGGGGGTGPLDDFPDFGDSGSAAREVFAFYTYWTNFATKMSFSWEDEYNPNDAPNRQVRRAIEKENGRERGAARRERTEALRALPRFRGEASFKTWITSIAVHVSQHHLRAGRYRRTVGLELVPEERVASSAPSGEHRIDERRMGERLYALLDQVAAPKRVAFLLFAIEGRPVEEVAALMGASQTATRSRVFFARRELRAMIAADHELTALASALLGDRREKEA
jgi:RNA polymerase sigma factor (sigma-70 family)